ncbi:hypothetical protein CH63R_05963 [Colletotrichum higginsianum IMI 349063]|uniref:Uncharacterized protein n=1 Tax=Colletotrichum higginsianum (strain IMI 349063) TaxID=759273 RepID=A0A1B7YDQ8_COLHI|nr:hypothetical protein CH63R_05963 [Colletotrichum higginsianum IMI 349063]OBR10271.1 hypothetical protein CH63R_05963 [Colletotrichum higginsianum IMI 349063]
MTIASSFPPTVSWVLLDRRDPRNVLLLLGHPADKEAEPLPQDLPCPDDQARIGCWAVEKKERQSNARDV